MHIAIVMNSAWGVRTLRADLIRFLQSEGHRVSVVCPFDDDVSELRRMEVSLVPWRLSRNGLNPFREALSVVGLRRTLSSLAPDVVLNFTPKAVLYGSIAARFVRNSCTFSVVTGLGLMFGGTGLAQKAFSPVLCFMIRVALRKNPMVFFHNPDDLKLFVAAGILPCHRTSRVCGSGVDTRRFCRTRTQGGRETTFVMIARLLRQKGVLEYLRAAAILKQEKQPIRALLVGPFDDHPAAVDPSVVQGYVDSDVVTYRGSTNDVRPHLDEADVFVLPSYYREGTPRSALEAMAMAMPIVTTDWPGCRETVVDGMNGYMVPVRDVGSLAVAMRRLVGDHRRIREMGSRSRRMAEDRYDVDKVNRHMLNEIVRARSVGGVGHGRS